MADGASPAVGLRQMFTARRRAIETMRVVASAMAAQIAPVPSVMTWNTPTRAASERHGLSCRSLTLASRSRGSPMLVYSDVTCPRCHSSGVTLFRLLRTSAIYLCSSCDHQWEGESRAPAPALAHSSDRS